MSDSLPFVFPISVLSFCGKRINVMFSTAATFAVRYICYVLCIICYIIYFHLKDVDKTPAELWIEVEVEEVSLVLLLLQNLSGLH